MPTAHPTIWLFEDQLSHNLNVLKKYPDSPVLLIESRKNMSLVPYHKKRLVYLISAMRHFAEELRSTGREVCYYGLNRKKYLDSLSAIRHHTKAHSNRLIIIEPSEFHTAEWTKTLPSLLNIEIETHPNKLFIINREAFRLWLGNQKSPVMENFYRKIRKQHNILMDEDGPTGGEWNFDKSNRKPLNKNIVIPPLPIFKPDMITTEVIGDVNKYFAHNPGDSESFSYPVTAGDAKRSLEEFLKHRLPHFGDFEDAMKTNQPFLFHSVLSPLINAGLLSPMECIKKAENAYRRGDAPLNCTEGFIRQILGWREYVYGLYWALMPEYRDRNTRKASRSLPVLFWNGETKLNCLHQTVTGLLEHGYTHHIQRLMVICNFATLTGLSPQQVNDWFLAMYIDSHDWVVTPNVIGMGLNADHNTIATKPYICSAAYINRMSDYCKSCTFNHKTRSESDSCPLNYLYWTFLDEYQSQMRSNPRMAMILKNLDRIDSNELTEMKLLRNLFLATL